MIKKIIKKIVRFLLWLLAGIVVLFIVAVVYTKTASVFGGSPDKITTKKIENSANYNGDSFVNFEETSVMHYTEDTNAWVQFPTENKNPISSLPSTKFYTSKFKTGSFAWLGHSTILMNIDSQVIVVDPVFYEASPISIGGKPFEIANQTVIADLPKINTVLISHDHYDHLDMKAIQEMKTKVEKFIVPLGIKAHLTSWGVTDDKIIELDWYESYKNKAVNFILTPSRHFSGRGILGRNTTLWGSWVIKGIHKNVYVTGDSGYTKEFKIIGEKYGPFDIAFLESGAYNASWSQIHMFPEQSVQAGIDVKAKVLFPIHWGKFDLAQHHWKEPISRFVKEAKAKQQRVATPIIGQIFDLSKIPQEYWWK